MRTARVKTSVAAGPPVGPKRPTGVTPLPPKHLIASSLPQGISTSELNAISTSLSSRFPDLDPLVAGPDEDRLVFRIDCDEPAKACIRWRDRVIDFGLLVEL